MSKIVYIDAPEGTHWPSDKEREAIFTGVMPTSHFRTVLRYDEDEGRKFWHPAIFDVKPTEPSAFKHVELVSEHGTLSAEVFELDADVAKHLACFGCGESPDYAVVEEGSSATFWCNDHV